MCAAHVLTHIYEYIEGCLHVRTHKQFLCVCALLFTVDRVHPQPGAKADAVLNSADKCVAKYKSAVKACKKHIVPCPNTNLFKCKDTCKQKFQGVYTGQPPSILGQLDFSGYPNINQEMRAFGSSLLKVA